MNAQKEFVKIVPEFMQAPASPQKSVGKKWVPRWKEGVYKAHAENLCHGYQATLLMILDTMKVLFIND